MIAKLTGKIDTIGSDNLIIDVGGVGYLVYASGRTLNRIPQRGSDVVLFVETVVREDAITLFGFFDEAEKKAFNTLTTVQGVGARLALAILSAFSVAELETAVGAGDHKYLTKANGVGGKLALRIVTELKGKMGAGLGLTSELQASGMAGGNGRTASAVIKHSAAEDTVSALVNLGYQKMDAVFIVNQILAANKAADNLELSAETLIRQALKELANK